MSLDKKYNIPAETVHRMVKDGVISCYAVRHHEIYDLFLQMKEANPSRSSWDICCDVANRLKVQPELAKKIVYTLGKKS